MPDNRTRLTAPLIESVFLEDIGRPLRNANGIIFPYTPSITYSQNVTYSQYDLMHTNYAINSYVNSRLGNISISAQFINQTLEEARYTYAAIHFLRVVTKSITGTSTAGSSVPNLGTPPPVLNFSSYGNGVFNRIPVLVGSFSTIFPNDVDYVTFDATEELTGLSLPVIMDIQIELMPQYSPTQQNNFDMSKFTTGKSYTDNRGFI